MRFQINEIKQWIDSENLTFHFELRISIWIFQLYRHDSYRHEAIGDPVSPTNNFGLGLVPIKNSLTIKNRFDMV